MVNSVTLSDFQSQFRVKLLNFLEKEREENSFLFGNIETSNAIFAEVLMALNAMGCAGRVDLDSNRTLDVLINTVTELYKRV